MVEQDKPHPDVVRRLIEDTGITEDQARDLVALLGPHNWASLVREAHILKRKP